MTDDERLIGRLERLGSSRSGALTDERLASIEARVASAVALTDPVLTDPATAESGRPHRLGPILLAVAALLVLFVVAAAWLGGSATLTVEVADGSVVIELPDGRSIAATVGIDVPDGSYVDVAEGASVTLGDDELGPGRYVVTDGRAVPRAATITASSTTTTVSDAVDGGVGQSGDGAVPVRTTTTRPATTVPGDRTRPTTTLDTRPSDTTPVVRPPPTTGVRRTTTTNVVDRGVPTSTVAPERPDLTTTTTGRTTTSTTLPVDGGRDG